MIRLSGSGIKNITSILLVFPFITFLFGCNDDNDVIENQEPTPLFYDSIPAIERSLDELESVQTSTPGKFKFAVMADSHRSHDNLQDAVDLINQENDILFVLHAGDLTVFGDTASLRKTQNILSNLNCPYFTVPGNHECNSLTLDKYREIFGETKYSFVFEDNLFLFIDTNFGSQSNSETVFNWMESELVNHTEYKNIFITSHVALGDNAYSDEENATYREIMATYEIDLSIHGHWHSYSYYGQSNCNTMYLICGPIMSGRTFCVVEVDGDVFEVEKVDY